MTSAIPFPTHVIGLMSGTSADGVDAAMLYTDGRNVVEAGVSHFVPYDDRLRADIFALMKGVGDEAAIATALTDVHIEAVRELLKKTDVEAHLVGFHGQTIRHVPGEGISVQIGEPRYMARELGIPVVADFRSNDIRHGGQGAPLVPLYHAALAHALPKPLMVVNIGGVSNITWVGQSPVTSHQSPEQAVGDLIAFDCGPGGALLDDWIFLRAGKRYDENGEIAARGTCDPELLRAFLDDPFFKLAAPKSLDRHYFSALVHGLLASKPMSVEDGAATLSHMTASAIGHSLSAVPAKPRQMLIAGGGRKNALLMKLIDVYTKVPVLAVEEVGWDGDMLEAQAFAYLAARSVQGLPLSLPTTTGVSEAVSGGRFFSVSGE